MQPVPASVWTLIAGIVISLISLWVGQHHGLLPEQASEQAPLVDGFFSVMVTIATALFLIVQGAILLFSIKFRRRPGDNTDGIPIEGSIPLEILWTSIPAVIVILLGIYSVDVYERMGGLAPAHHGAMAHHAPARMSGVALAAPMRADAEVGSAPLATTSTRYGIGNAQTDKVPDLVVDVTAMQYAWIFTYPTSGIVAGELHVPIGQDVQVRLTAQDVIHSFWVPQFRMKQDAIPGQPSEMRFTATKLGTYPIVCTELCGSYHGSMRTQLIVETPEAFAAWQAENQVAQQSEVTAAIALQPAPLSDSAFLAPYGHEMGVDAAILAQLHL